MQTQPAEIEALGVSLTPRAELILTLAAKAAGCPLEEFVLESALAHARETLPDRQHFGLDAEQWARFLAALDEPPRKLMQIRELFGGTSLFDAGEPG